MEELPIPDEDDISRFLIRPDAFSRDELNMISEETFIDFQSKHGYSDSAVWRSFAKTDEEVHALGLVVAEVKQERRLNKGGVAEYAGFMTASAGAIRAIHAPGVKLGVVHRPEEGDHHAEIFCDRNDRSQKISLGIKNNLKLMLYSLMIPRFAPFVSE